MRTITDHLTTVDGVSDGLAADIADRFDTYADLAAASVDDLRAVKGVGPVLATRIQAAAIEASPAAATAARADEAGAAARTTAQKASTKADTKATSSAKEATDTAKATGKKATDTATSTSKKATTSGKKAAASVSTRADKSATAAKAAASRARTKAEEAVDEATDTAAGVADGAAAATSKADRDFSSSIDRRSFGPITLPADLPWPVSFALDTTEAVVGVGLKVTTGVLATVGRKLR